MTEWCECLGASTFTALFPTTLTGHQAWVHDSCGKPTFEYWQKYEKYCDECGRSFSSPYSDECSSCANPQYLVSWSAALHLTAATIPFGTAAAIVRKTAA